MMKISANNESKTIAMILFILTLIPGAILMCRNMDNSIVTDHLSEHAIEEISRLFITEIAGILAYIGCKAYAVFRRPMPNHPQSRADSLMAGFVLLLFLALAVLLLYAGVVEPFLR
ncbi:MAG: hypothetical protein ACI4V1_07320 [Eubacteriales bacterium]